MPSLENGLAVSQKVKIKLPYDPVIPLLGTPSSTPRSPKRTVNLRSHTDLCMNIHSSIIIIARKWNTAQGPSADAWINNVVYPSMKYYSTIKRNEAPINAVA